MHTNFSMNDQSLFLDVQTTDLEAYRWNTSDQVPVFFVFVDEKVHIITLDDQEEPFQKVCSLTQTVPVRLVTDEEVEQYGVLYEQNALAAV